MSRQHSARSIQQVIETPEETVLRKFMPFETTGGEDRLDGTAMTGFCPPTQQSRARVSDHIKLAATAQSATQEITMPTMSNLRRRKIQARQRKLENSTKRAAKADKKARNAAKA
jgi:hypothetical protein